MWIVRRTFNNFHNSTSNVSVFALKSAVCTMSSTQLIYIVKSIIRCVIDNFLIEKPLKKLVHCSDLPCISYMVYICTVFFRIRVQGHSSGLYTNTDNIYWVAVLRRCFITSTRTLIRGGSQLNRSIGELSPLSPSAVYILGPDPINNVWRITPCTVIYRRHVAELSRGQAKFTNRLDVRSICSTWPRVCGCSGSPRSGLRSLVIRLLRERWDLIISTSQW